MITLPASTDPQPFFTAVFPGFYAFARRLVSGTFYVNGAAAAGVGGVGGPASNQRSHLVVWLDAEDVVAYSGPGADIYGSRFAADELA